MFAKVIVHGGTRKDAVLIPQKAVKGLLDKNFVMVIDAGGHAESKQVQLGEKVGNMVIVSQGLEGNELIVSEGVDKVKKDSVLSVTVEDPADTGTEK
jgi:membrane fusion protein (multidrug efflux system)